MVEGSVKELSEKFNVNIMTMTGFLDGINDSLVKENPIEEMEEETVVSLGFDKELLYKKHGRCRSRLVIRIRRVGCYF